MYLSAMCYPVLPTAFICICLNCQYYVVLLEHTNKDIIYIINFWAKVRQNRSLHLLVCENTMNVLLARNDFGWFVQYNFHD